MNRRLTPQELDRALRALFRNEVCSDAEETSDSVFLTAYRDKLRRSRTTPDLLPLPIGEWSWRAAPVLLLMVALLAVSLWSLTSRMSPQTDPAEGLLWTVVEEGVPELTEDQIVEIAVSRSTGR